MAKRNPDRPSMGDRKRLNWAVKNMPGYGHENEVRVQLKAAELKDEASLAGRSAKINRLTGGLSRTGKVLKSVKGLPSMVEFVNTQAAKAAADRPVGLTSKKVKVKGKGRKA